MDFPDGPRRCSALRTPAIALMDLPRYGLRSMMHEACANFSGGRFPVRVVDRAGPVVAGRPAGQALSFGSAE